MPAPIGDKERHKIAAALRSGGKRNEVARDFKRSAGAISKIAKEEGIEFDRSHTKKATEARLAYGEDRRLELIGKGFEKASALLEALQDAGEFRNWTIGFGTLVDKARLETGKATSRTETVDPEVRRRVRAGLDELAKRRMAQ